MNVMMNAIENGHTTVWATYLLLVMPIVTMLSTTLMSVSEILLYLLFLATPELRKRFVSSLSQPIVIFGFCLYFIIIVSSFWSNEAWESKLEAIKSCRRILLLPMAISLINNSVWKDRFLLVFIFSVTAVAFLSWFSWMNDIIIYKPADGILRNSLTQSLVVFAAAFASACMVVCHKGISLKMKSILTICFLVTISNGVIVGTGRSGYLLWMVLIGCFGIYAGKGKNLLITPLLLVITAGIFYLSPVPHSRITEGLENVNSNSLTSMSLRVVFWKNSLKIIQKSPFVGHGLRSYEAKYAEQVAGIEGWGKSIRGGGPHNEYLFVLVEQGAVGLIAFLAFILSCFFQKTEPFYRFMGLSMLVGWMATALFNDNFSLSSEGRFVLLWCAAMLSMPVEAQASRPLANNNVAIAS